MEAIGFVGLGNMGSALAANLVGAGWPVVAFDRAGPDRCPDGARFARHLEEVAGSAEIVVLSLPDGKASEAVTANLAAADAKVTHVIDTSTVGVTAARRIAAGLAESGVAYVDAPVSGGVAGARARTLMVMYAGEEEACRQVQPVIEGLSDRRRQVGNEPGMAQALKLANNFLSATALLAASEAVAFGLSVGLDMETMLDVINSSSGQSAATTDKFPHHVLTGRYAAGFANTLMAKDLRLYLGEVSEQGAPSEIGALTASVWERFAADEPDVDFTRIFRYVDGG